MTTSFSAAYLHSFIFRALAAISSKCESGLDNNFYKKIFLSFCCNALTHCFCDNFSQNPKNMKKIFFWWKTANSAQSKTTFKANCFSGGGNPSMARLKNRQVTCVGTLKPADSSYRLKISKKFQASISFWLNFSPSPGSTVTLIKTECTRGMNKL